MIEVYHMRSDLSHEQRRSMMFSESDAAAQALWAADGYEKVAVVSSDDLEFAWRWTNNVDTSWSMEPHISVTVTAPLHVVEGKTYGRKSSEVGDIFVLNGVRYIVAMLGMRILD